MSKFRYLEKSEFERRQHEALNVRELRDFIGEDLLLNTHLASDLKNPSRAPVEIEVGLEDLCVKYMGLGGFAVCLSMPPELEAQTGYEISGLKARLMQNSGHKIISPDGYEYRFDPVDHSVSLLTVLKKGIIRATTIPRVNSYLLPIDYEEEPSEDDYLSKERELVGAF